MHTSRPWSSRWPRRRSPPSLSASRSGGSSPPARPRSPASSAAWGPSSATSRRSTPGQEDQGRPGRRYRCTSTARRRPPTSRCSRRRPSSWPATGTGTSNKGSNKHPSGRRPPPPVLCQPHATRPRGRSGAGPHRWVGSPRAGPLLRRGMKCCPCWPRHARGGCATRRRRRRRPSPTSAPPSRRSRWVRIMVRRVKNNMKKTRSPTYLGLSHQPPN